MSFVASLGLVARLRELLQSRGIWLDESLITENIQERGLPELLFWPLARDQSAPMPFLTGLWTTTLPNRDWDLLYRLTPFFMSIVLMAAVALLAFRSLDSTAARLTLVGLAGFSPRLLYYATEIKQYGGDAAVASLVLVLLLWVQDRPHEARRAARLGLLLPFVSLPAVFMLAGAGVVLGSNWLKRDLRAELRTVAGGWLVGSLAAAAVSRLLTSDLQFFQNYWRDGFGPSIFRDPFWYPGRLFGLFTVNDGLGPANADSTVPQLSLATGILGGLAVLGAIRALTRHTKASSAVGCGLLAVAFVWVASLFSIYPFAGRLVMFLLPSLFLSIACGVEAIASFGFGFLRLRSGKVCCALVAFMLVVAVNSRSYSYLADSGDRGLSRSAMQFIGTHREPDDAVVIVHYDKTPYEFYEPSTNLGEPDAIIGRDFDPTSALAQLKAEQHRRVWVMVVHRLPQGKAMLKSLSHDYPVLESYDGESSAALLLLV